MWSKQIILNSYCASVWTAEGWNRTAPQILLKSSSEILTHHCLVSSVHLSQHRPEGPLSVYEPERGSFSCCESTKW